MRERLFLVATLLASSLTACDTRDAGDPRTITDPVAMACFTADIQAVSRASADGTAFTDGDKVGIVPLCSGNVDEQQNNTPYIYDGSRFAPVDSPYWFKNRNDVTFNAYYPFAADMTDNKIPIDTKAENQTLDGNGWRLNDILFASAVTNVASPTVSYTGDHAFSHQLSKLTLIFNAGDGFADLSELQDYTLGTLATQGDFNTATGTIGLAATEDPTDITMTVSGSAGTSLAATPLILLPQSITEGALSLEVTFGGQRYRATLPVSDGLRPGKHYTYTVTIKGTDLTIGTPQIVDWETTDGDSVHATMPDED